MRTFQRAVLALSLVLVYGRAGWAQTNNETFSAGAGGGYDASDCNDPQIAVIAKQQNATPYYDHNWNAPGDSLVAVLRYLSQKYNDGNIDHASACANAPGVVFFVPNNRVAEVTTLIGQIEASQPGGAAGANGNGSGNTPTSGQPGQSGGSGGSSGPS
jgi:hypothetical protein